jgi:hypothetical protein
MHDTATDEPMIVSVTAGLQRGEWFELEVDQIRWTRQSALAGSRSPTITSTTRTSGLCDLSAHAVARDPTCSGGGCLRWSLLGACGRDDRCDRSRGCNVVANAENLAALVAELVPQGGCPGADCGVEEVLALLVGRLGRGRGRRGERGGRRMRLEVHPRREVIGDVREASDEVVAGRGANQPRLRGGRLLPHSLICGSLCRIPVRACRRSSCRGSTR